MKRAGDPSAPARLTTRQAGERTLLVSLTGDWRGDRPLPGPALVHDALAQAPAARELRFDLVGVEAWDSGLIAFLLRCQELGDERQVRLDREALPSGVRRLLELATSVPRSDLGRTAETMPDLVVRTGLKALSWLETVRHHVGFIGDLALALARLLPGRAVFRRQDLLSLAQQCGVDALPIVALIAGLVGLILAFVGSVQLASFGAAIYVADTVAIAMVREMGCMMTAIIMCGRTGAAFAAQLGTMKVNQELDAFSVFGIPPMDFLVVPRVLALLAMMPLLTVFANAVGIAGGFAVAMLMLDLSAVEYWNQTIQALSLTQFSTGMVKSVAFGLVVGMCGCLRGMQCGTNAAAVGQAATSAVVTGITWIVIADALFAFIFNVLGI